jgi:hypothetical protein
LIDSLVKSLESVEEKKPVPSLPLETATTPGIPNSGKRSTWLNAARFNDLWWK